jgi:hypothetical protein
MARGDVDDPKQVDGTQLVEKPSSVSVMSHLLHMSQPGHWSSHYSERERICQNGAGQAAPQPIDPTEHQR